MMIMMPKQLFYLLFTVLTVFFLLSSGEEGWVIMYNSVTKSPVGAGSFSTVHVIVSFLSAWFLLLGIMCRRLESIPEVKTRRRINP